MNSLGDVQLGKLLAQVSDFGQIIDHNVRLIRMMSRIVLMISLGLVKGFESDHLCDNGLAKDVRLIQLINIGSRNTFLVFVSEEDDRTILRTPVRPLSIQLR